MKTTFAILAAVVMICGFAAPATAEPNHNFWLEAWRNDNWPEFEIAVSEVLEFHIRFTIDDVEGENFDPQEMTNSLPGAIYYYGVDAEVDFDDTAPMPRWPGANGWNCEYMDPQFDWIIQPQPEPENPRGPKDFDPPNDDTDPREWLFEED